VVSREEFTTRRWDRLMWQPCSSGAIRTTRLVGWLRKGPPNSSQHHTSLRFSPVSATMRTTKCRNGSTLCSWRILRAIRFDHRWLVERSQVALHSLGGAALPSISAVTRSNEDAVISLMTLAFSDDPATRWMFPDPRQYLTHYPTFVRLYAGAAFDSGNVYAVAGGAGFAMWLPPGIGSDEEGLADLLRRSVEPSRLAEIFDLVQQMASYQPAEPHWFLPLIGADPIRRGKGYGSALLAHMVAQCDQQLAYLDSTNSRNVPLYERHGFERLGVIKVGSCPPVYPMLRRPR
jgi:GNAT superfamily N-acetyltransferase